MKQPDWMLYEVEEERQTGDDWVPWNAWDYVIITLFGALVIAWVGLLIELAL